MSDFLRLHQYARVIPLSDDRVHVGPIGAGLVLDGLRPADLALLADLEQAREAQALRRPRRATSTAAATHCADLVATLRHHRLLVHAPSPHRAGRDLDADAAARAAAYRLDDDGHELLSARRRAWVLLDGSGRLPEAIATTLRDGSLGRVTVGTSAADDVEMRMRAHRGPTPDLVVLLGSGSVPFTRAEAWRGRNVPHLPVVVDGPGVSVGPVIDGTGPCLACIDLHRADQDPQWPAMLRHLSCRPHLEAVDLDIESTLRGLTCGLVAALIHAHLDDRDTPPGHAIDVTLPLPTIVHRQWQIHPRCRCTRERETMTG